MFRYQIDGVDKKLGDDRSERYAGGAEDGNNLA